MAVSPGWCGSATSRARHRLSDHRRLRAACGWRLRYASRRRARCHGVGISKRSAAISCGRSRAGLLCFAGWRFLQVVFRHRTARRQSLRLDAPLACWAAAACSMSRSPSRRRASPSVQRTCRARISRRANGRHGSWRSRSGGSLIALIAAGFVGRRDRSCGESVPRAEPPDRLDVDAGSSAYGRSGSDHSERSDARLSYFS